MDAALLSPRQLAFRLTLRIAELGDLAAAGDRQAMERLEALDVALRTEEA